MGFALQKKCAIFRLKYIVFWVNVFTDKIRGT